MVAGGPAAPIHRPTVDGCDRGSAAEQPALGPQPCEDVLQRGDDPRGVPVAFQPAAGVAWVTETGETEPPPRHARRGDARRRGRGDLRGVYGGESHVALPAGPARLTFWVGVTRGLGRPGPGL